MSETINALRAVEEEFKRLAIILPKDDVKDVADAVLKLDKELPQDTMMSRILLEMSQNGYICPVIVNGEEKDYLTEKLIEILAFTKAYNVYSNSALEIKCKSDSEKHRSFLDHFLILYVSYCEDKILEEEHITNPKFLEFYKKSLEEYHKKFARA